MKIFITKDRATYPTLPKRIVLEPAFAPTDYDDQAQKLFAFLVTMLPNRTYERLYALQREWDLANSAKGEQMLKNPKKLLGYK